eukprot:4740254-Amphidinium_carterae.1
MCCGRGLFGILDGALRDLMSEEQTLQRVAYRGSLVQFGETCLFRVSFSSSGRFRQAKVGKADLRFQKGLFVGKSYDGDEWMMLTPSGMFTSRTLKRLPLESQCDAQLVLAVKGTPWEPEGQQTPPLRAPAFSPIVRGPDSQIVAKLLTRRTLLRSRCR